MRDMREGAPCGWRGERALAMALLIFAWFAGLRAWSYRVLAMPIAAALFMSFMAGPVPAASRVTR